MQDHWIDHQGQEIEFSIIADRVGNALAYVGNDAVGKRGKPN